MAINAWTSENGQHIQRNVQAFLEGYNSVREIGKDVTEALPFLGRAASFSRALLRTEIALNTAQEANANSPEECINQLKAWRIKDEQNIPVFQSYNIGKT